MTCTQAAHLACRQRACGLRLAWCGLVVALFAACSSPTTGPATGESSDALSDAVAPNFGTHDATTKDGIAGQDGGDAGAKDAVLADQVDATDALQPDGDAAENLDDTQVADAVDSKVDADPDPGCNFPTNPAPGEPGATCKSADDCDSGFCIAGPDGKLCTAACISCCPAGFQCGKMVGVDGAFACLPKQLALCQPCLTDAECGQADAGALCLSYGASGHFCGTGCTGDIDCLSGYTCQDADGQLGAAKQCVRTQGECTCTQWGALVGAATVCSQQNDSGTCTGTRKCAIAGLTACSAPAPATETCNGVDDNCDGVTDPANAAGCESYYLDNDGDGFGGGKGNCLCSDPGLATTQGGDCNDQQASLHPGAKEICDGLDNNCDGQTDPGFPDSNGDGFADCVDPDIDGDGTANANDCAPANAAIYPGAQETCDGMDNDCNGVTDDPGANGCTQWFLDSDGDGSGAGSGKCLCDISGSYTANSGGDCNNANAAVHPGAFEVCNDTDDNCNGQTDEGCDDDLDLWCDATITVVGTPATCANGKQDCNDAVAGIHPGQAEICGNGLDDNCDGLTDMGANLANCTVFYVDNDGDGAGDKTLSLCLCAATSLYTVAAAGDCDDTSPAIGPKALEVCNGVDDNCDGVTDPVNTADCGPFFKDSDADGYGNVASGTKCLCAAVAGYVAKAGDCDDGDAAVHPNAVESCNGIDDNCDNAIDPVNAAGCTTYHIDGDGDGYGQAFSQCACASSGYYTSLNADDCDDSNGSIHPQAVELCDGADNNCDGQTDEGVQGKYYADGDGDGYGAGIGHAQCASSDAFPAVLNGDCNDANKDIHPLATEICNLLDDNCNGAIDEGTSSGTYYQDSDQDGYGNLAVSKEGCGAPAGYVVDSTDCDDTKAAVNTGVAKDTCATAGVDDNCDGVTDGTNSTACASAYPDADGDTFGSKTSTATCVCAGTPGYVATKTDCDDTKAGINPNATEICDGLDNNCDGSVDPQNTSGCVTYFLDADTDGFGVSGSTQCWCSAHLTYSASVGGDCNDAAVGIYPGATETCNLKDDDCDSVVDDGLATVTSYKDADGDGYGDAGTPLLNSCLLTGYVANSSDCDETKAAVNPAAVEVCNGIDDNCDGQTDPGCPTCTSLVVNSLDAASNLTAYPGDWWPGDYGLANYRPATHEGAGYLRWGGSSGCGYYPTTYGTDLATWKVTLPTGTASITLAVAIDNTDTFVSGVNKPDTLSYLVITFDGVSMQLGPYPTWQTLAWKDVKFPVTAVQCGKPLAMTATVVSPNGNGSCHGGFFIDNIRASSCN